MGTGLPKCWQAAFPRTTRAASISLHCSVVTAYTLPPHRLSGRLCILAFSAVLAYAPSLSIPLIADDYPNLVQAQTYGSTSGLPVLLNDAQFRLRSTTYWAMFGLWRIGGVRPAVYHAASLALHVANVWLLFFVAVAWPRMRGAAFWAGLFFAVQEGHQEAVMWFSAINELLMFFFGMASLLCWLRAGAGKRRWWLEVAGTALFALALLSKESALVLLPLYFLAIPDSDRRATLLSLLPRAALAALAVASIAASRSNSFRFSDGSFSLHAPVWTTWPYGIARLLWIWGWPALLVILLSKERRLRRSGMLALAWMGMGLAPYSFLAYSTRIPSRQTYLASAGLAFLFGLACAHVEEKWPRRTRLVAALAGLMVVHNVAYLWTRKRTQFLQRAAPTEQLIALARRTPGPIWVRCFPQPPLVAERAVQLAAGRSSVSLVWHEAEAAAGGAIPFCYRAP